MKPLPSVTDSHEVSIAGKDCIAVKLFREAPDNPAAGCPLQMSPRPLVEVVQGGTVVVMT